MEWKKYDSEGREVIQQPTIPTNAPVGAPYLTISPDATLTAEFALSSIGTGILKNNPGSNPSVAVNVDLPLMAGATGGAAGERGAVPKPVAGEQAKFLRGDGTWQAITVGGGAGAVVELVARTTLGANASSINLTGIPSTYHILRLLAELRTDIGGAAEDTVRVRVNGDSGTNYSYMNENAHHNNVRTTTAAVTQTGAIMAAAAAGSTSTADWRSFVDLWIIGYTQSTRPRRLWWTAILPRVTGDATMLYYTHGFGMWINSANAIDQITLTPGAGSNFVIGSTYALYAMGAA